MFCAYNVIIIDNFSPQSYIVFIFTVIFKNLIVLKPYEGFTDEERERLKCIGWHPTASKWQNWDLNFWTFESGLTKPVIFYRIIPYSISTRSLDFQSWPLGYMITTVCPYHKFFLLNLVASSVSSSFLMMVRWQRRAREESWQLWLSLCVQEFRHAVCWLQFTSLNWFSFYFDQIYTSTQ